VRIAIWRRNKYQQYLSSNKFQYVNVP
jgi:hypothetical protein